VVVAAGIFANASEAGLLVCPVKPGDDSREAVPNDSASMFRGKFRTRHRRWLLNGAQIERGSTWTPA
jgi:hypothetical protein